MWSYIFKTKPYSEKKKEKMVKVLVLEETVWILYFCNLKIIFKWKFWFGFFFLMESSTQQEVEGIGFRAPVTPLI